MRLRREAGVIDLLGSSMVGQRRQSPEKRTSLGSERKLNSERERERGRTMVAVYMYIDGCGAVELSPEAGCESN